jgi:hypothetical protein
MNHEWRDRAACRGAETDVFFPDGTCLRAGDPGSAADELESQLRILHLMSRLAGHDTAAGAVG